LTFLAVGVLLALIFDREHQKEIRRLRKKLPRR
jgi:hypothetical protein